MSKSVSAMSRRIFKVFLDQKGILISEHLLNVIKGQRSFEGILWPERILLMESLLTSRPFEIKEEYLKFF